LKLVVLDEDTMTNDKVGEAVIKISALCTSGGIDEWFEILYEGKLAGKVHLVSVFIPKVKSAPLNDKGPTSKKLEEV
jgi:hypothetical protein